MLIHSLVSIAFSGAVIIVGGALAIQLVAQFGFIGLGIVLLAAGFVMRK